MFHIRLHAGSALDEQHASLLFSKLAAHELSNCSITNHPGSRYCPLPGCERLLMPAPCPGAWNIMLCDCGNTLCGDCSEILEACACHPGIGCSEAKVLRKEVSGHDQDIAEYYSSEYVMQNSRPCPKCSVPIVRESGCDHMFCNQCEFHYCWQCGRSHTNESCDGRTIDSYWNQNLHERRKEFESLASRVLWFTQGKTVDWIEAWISTTVA